VWVDEECEIGGWSLPGFDMRTWRVPRDPGWQEEFTEPKHFENIHV